MQQESFAELIDMIFDVLLVHYGAAWLRQWEGVEMNLVKSHWGSELAGFARNPEPLRYALSHLPERCPNVTQFRAIANSCPLPEQERLPAPKADPAKAQQVLAKVRAVGAGVQAADPKAWAHRIMGRVDAGDKTVSPYARKCAEMALGKRKDMGA